MATRNKRTVAEAGPTATFEVLSNLSLDNEDFVPGDTVELSEEQAIEIGPQVVKPVAAKAE
ncbi:MULTISPECIES: hypothetical protein [unclassified Variovorax]|jgi:hypothetical protein|uniref:hypothetical protein n=1 Tax=unclassified Variovorax TaxID=663243 RepID=UPI000F7F6785|nr:MULTISPECIES: hypothetical protein [unclassified Variovorax]RSZ35082.1 hypothetical protein EJO70_24720 [Variovorax sp. 553]RSZ35900.1 hypothetical protein EJO71_25770 [Variovorax sp. 679]